MTEKEQAARELVVKAALEWGIARAGNETMDPKTYVPRAVVVSSELLLRAAVRDLQKLMGK